MARPFGTKYIETPEKLWELFMGYKEWVINNPILVQDFVGKDGEEVHRKKQRPMTMEGFECFVMDNTEIKYPDLTEYFEQKNESYKDYFPIASRIKSEIRNNQLEGGLIMIYSQTLTARLNGLTEKTENKNETNGELVVRYVDGTKPA